jgi:hypothetical protein
MNRQANTNCAGCGKQVTGVSFIKCIRCGREYCEECWQDDFLEVCPRCSRVCTER